VEGSTDEKDNEKESEIKQIWEEIVEKGLQTEPYSLLMQEWSQMTFEH